MVKAKRGKKAAKDGSDDSDVDQVDELAENVDNLSLKAKKGQSKKKPARAGFELLLSGENENESHSSDSDNEPTQSKSKSKSKSIRKSKDSDTSEEDELPSKSVKNKGNKKGKGAILQEDNSGNSETEEASKPKAEEAKGGKKSKRKKKKDESDEDIEKILAELQMEYSGGKPPVTDPEEGKSKKKGDDSTDPDAGKSKKKICDSKAQPERTVSVSEDDPEATNATEVEKSSSTVKSAAQKKREKREREKLKKQAQKQTDVKPPETITETQAETPTEDKAEVVENEKSEEQADDEAGKKKKAKKGAAAAAAESKDEKKPVKKKMIMAIQEAQRKAQEEEERLRKEEEAEEARIAALEAARLEAERLEQERKERKKKREKERKERLKAEGKLLTPKQRADRARAQAMLEALGVAPPPAGEKKFRPGTRIRPSKNKQAQQNATEAQTETQKNNEGSENQEQIMASEQQTLETKTQSAEVVEEVKDSWDAESESDPDTEPVECAAPVPTTAPPPPAKEIKEASPPEASKSETETEEESSEESDSEESDAGSHDHITEQERKKAKAIARIEKRRVEAEKNRSPDVLRAAVICVLGHVDTGKTKILDKLRRTSVQAGEAGGITQQIGATNVPMDAIKEQAKHVKGFSELALKLPGLLIIDTPGHASFSNLRSRGSSLCDMAILVVDIMHGLEEQTLESINLLKTKKTPFVVALNKIDRLYDWTTVARKDIRDILKAQASNTQAEFERRTKDVVLQFAEQGLNAALFYENPDPRTYVSLVPTSAITGEGMGNLLALLVENCQSMLTRRLMYSEELQATVLEVKAITGLGTTIDCILVNGRLREGDTVVLASSDGNAIVTQIRSLLMPQPMKELRVKNEYIEYKEIEAAQGVKIAAKDLEKAIAGLNMLVARQPDEVEVCKEEVVRDLARELGRIKLQAAGVLVQASTLGSLEALLEFLKDSKIPYSSVKIGPVVKKDVMRAASMLERESQYGTILAFDVKVERDAQEMADSLGVKIFQADIIYHLFDQFTAHREQLRQSKRQQFKNIAVFPCKLRILPQFVFNSRDPIVAGVMVEDGIVCVGTPICVPNKESSDPSQYVDLGVVTSIESNHKAVESARRGQEVCVKIESTGDGAPKMFGRHFDEKDLLISKISRQSIDACKEYFREDLLKSDWQLMVELKRIFQIL